MEAEPGGDQTVQLGVAGGEDVQADQAGGEAGTRLPGQNYDHFLQHVTSQKVIWPGKGSRNMVCIRL